MRVSERTRRTAGAANSSRMWDPVHEVLLDRDNRLLLMRSPLLHHYHVLSGRGRGDLAAGLWLQVVLVFEMGAYMTFPPCWYFMIKLKCSPEVYMGDFPLICFLRGSSTASETAKYVAAHRAQLPLQNCF